MKIIDLPASKNLGFSSFLYWDFQCHFSIDFAIFLKLPFYIKDGWEICPPPTGGIFAIFNKIVQNAPIREGKKSQKKCQKVIFLSNCAYNGPRFPRVKN